ESTSRNITSARTDLRLSSKRQTGSGISLAGTSGDNRVSFISPSRGNAAGSSPAVRCGGTGMWRVGGEAGSAHASRRLRGLLRLLVLGIVPAHRAIAEGVWGGDDRGSGPS